MTVEPNYIKKLEQQNEKFKHEIREVKGENIYLKQRIKDLVSENTKLQNDLFTDQLQTDESEHKIEQLKQKINDLISNYPSYTETTVLKEQNAQLKEDYKQKIEDMKSLSEELYYSSNKIIELKTKLYDAHVKEQRLIKILNETSDYT